MSVEIHPNYQPTSEPITVMIGGEMPRIAQLGSKALDTEVIRSDVMAYRAEGDTLAEMNDGSFSPEDQQVFDELVAAHRANADEHMQKLGALTSGNLRSMNGGGQ